MCVSPAGGGRACGGVPVTRAVQIAIPHQSTGYEPSLKYRLRALTRALVQAAAVRADARRRAGQAEASRKILEARYALQTDSFEQARQLAREAGLALQDADVGQHAEAEVHPHSLTPLSSLTLTRSHSRSLALTHANTLTLTLTHSLSHALTLSLSLTHSLTRSLSAGARAHRRDRRA